MDVYWEIRIRNFLSVLILLLLRSLVGAGQSCTQIQLNSTLSCYANLNSKLESLLNSWPASNVILNLTNPLVNDICKAYADANACTNTSICISQPQVANTTAIADYICNKQNGTFLAKSDCVQKIRNSNDQILANCNYLSAASHAMKYQMTSVNMCDYYKDAASCAFNITQNACGTDTATSFMGLHDIITQKRFTNCSFVKCGDNNTFCQWGQICRSSRTCTCATVCPQMYESVCANNGLNYANYCLMRNDACTSNSWFIKRPQIYCDLHLTNTTTCDDKRIDPIMNCTSILYSNLIQLLSTTGAFLFSATSQQLNDHCTVYNNFKNCIQMTSNQCNYQNMNILKQFYDYLCSTQANTDLITTITTNCRRALYSDTTVNTCVKNYNQTLVMLPYYGLKQYTFSLSDEMTNVCDSTNDLYICSNGRIQALCDQNNTAIFAKLFHGSFDLFQQNCNQGCKSVMGDTYGVISTNNWPYRRNVGLSKCTWHIQVPNGLNVNLIIYPNRPFDCQATKTKFINVYSGETENPANLLGNFCPSNPSASKGISTLQSTNRMTVVYSGIGSDGSRSPDFIAMYYAGTDACASNPCTSGNCVNQIGGYFCQSIFNNDTMVIQHDPVCASGWTLYLNKCYVAYKATVDQPTAELGCRNGAGHLTAILSSAENDFITQLATRMGAQTIWTGLRFEDNTRWRWLSQEGAAYFNWNTAQPVNPSSQRCVVLNAVANGVWETRQCYPNTADGYVCKTSPTDYCNPNPCQNGGSCSSTGTGAYCRCTSGYTGVVCDQQQLNACTSNPCLNGATCTNTGNGYACRCVPGYTGTSCSIDINECASNPCLNGGTCVDAINQYICRCPTGFSGTTCATTSNPCSPSPCQNGGTCTATSSTTYTCTCPSGYAGITCSAVGDSCASAPCLNGGTCSRGSTGGFTCTCLSAYTGQTCAILVQTACSSNPCRNGGTCTNTQTTSWGYLCTCPAGYAGINCDIGSNLCANFPCQNGGTCSSSSGSIVCTCVTGFMGTRCEININECASNPCQNGGTCVDGVNEFSCKCAPTWSGALCTQRITNCEPNPCKHQGTCVVLSVTEYICKCADGWVGSQCENDNDECGYNPCSTSATCLNTYGSYTCVCPSGVSTCGNAGACSGGPCHNGGTCLASGSTYSCSCPSEYSGPTCDVAVCDSGWKYNMGYCYYVSPTPTSSMNDGQKYCVQQGGDLTSIRSLDERDFIGKQMAAKNVDKAWIGARVRNNAWTWTDGMSWSYTSWYTNEPKDSSGVSCVRVITGYGFSWDTISCDNLQSFVCKKLAYGSKNNCIPNPCQNGGACINLVDRYECSCPTGYTGANCQTSTGTGWGCPCQNGGTCNNGKCICMFGFTGASCQVPCPAGWSWSNSICYFGVNNPSTYDQATAFCPKQQTGSYLLTTTSQQEFDYAGILMNQMQSNVWLGIRYNPTQSQFIWVTGVPLNPSDFKAWGTNQPNSPQTRNCGRITGYNGFIWETEDCNRSMKFICKYAG